MDWLSDPQVWASLLTLTTLEIVLGIDNLIFIAILASRLPPAQQEMARRLGLLAALLTRLILLASIAWLIGLAEPLFTIAGHAFSWRDLILIAGGLFLVAKGTGEIHQRIEGGEHIHDTKRQRPPRLAGTIAQIMLLDIVFSLDSVIMAVGMADHLFVMMVAVVIAVGVMFLAAGAISGFVEQHPTVKMLALSFLLLIGTTLIADGFGAHVPKGYIYAAVAFSMVVELLNQISARRTARPRIGEAPPRRPHTAE